jgi:uncharacterized membrane protein YkgB
VAELLLMSRLMRGVPSDVCVMVIVMVGLILISANVWLHVLGVYGSGVSFLVAMTLSAVFLVVGYPLGKAWRRANPNA